MTTVIQCSVEGCPESFTTDELVSESVRFICRKHPRKVQTETAGRVYDPVNDEKDSSIRFQPYQHDEEMDNERKPMETEHIPTGKHVHKNSDGDIFRSL